MTNNVKPWPKAAGRAEVELSKPIIRPCDWGLIGAVTGLETQLGTIEAYNRLATAAHKLKAKIDAGQAEQQNPIYAVSTGARTD